MDWSASRFGSLTNGYLLGTLALILLITFWRSLLTHIRIFAALWSVPGPPAYPLFGNALMFQGGPEEFFKVIKECCNRYGSMFRLWIGPRAIVYLSSADVMQPILSSSIHIQKSEEYKCIEPWLGTGLLTSGGLKWHHRRKLLTAAFHSTIFESYLDSLSKNANILVSKLYLHNSIDSPAQWSEPIDVVPFTKLCALDAICETIMGLNISAQEGDSNAEYINSIERISKILQHRFITPWLRSDFIFYNTSQGKEFDRHVKIIHNFTNKVIKERKEELRSQTEGNQSTQSVSKVQQKRKSLLDLLLDLSENGSVLSSEDIREEVDTFMFAGHDTTATALNWSMYTLGHHPEVQERILEEAKSTMDDDHTGKVTLAQINKMEFLDRVMKEVLRMYPPVPHIGRDLDAPLTINGHTFPAGTSITISMFMLHRDPKFFPDPNKFDPDRFLPSENLDRHPFAYTPFSAGSRNCIGQKFAIMELKIVILKVLQSLEIKSICELENLNLHGEIILLSPDGVKLSFRKRSQ